MANPHDGHRKRKKEEFLAKGMGHFPDHEKLELLLFFAVPRGDTNVIGHALMERFGSLTGVFDAPFELLRECDGVGAQSATLIKTVSALTRAYMDDCANARNAIKTTTDAKEYMRYKFLGESVERVIMACIGGNGKVVFCGEVVHGSPENVQVKASDLIRQAIIANAVRVVLAHNHPGGISSPSRQDVHTTRILYDEFARVNVELMDHIIAAPDGVFSMQEAGMMPQSAGPRL